MERDLGSVVGDLAKPQTTFTFRTTVRDEVLLSSMERDKPSDEAETGKHPAALLFESPLLFRIKS